MSVLSFMLELGRSLVVMWEGGVAGGWGLGVLGGLWSVCLLVSRVSVPSFMLELGRSLVVMWEGGVAGGGGLGVLGGLWWCGGVSCYLPEQG